MASVTSSIIPLYCRQSIYR